MFLLFRIDSRTGDLRSGWWRLWLSNCLFFSAEYWDGDGTKGSTFGQGSAFRYWQPTVHNSGTGRAGRNVVSPSICSERDCSIDFVGSDHANSGNTDHDFWCIASGHFAGQCPGTERTEIQGGAAKTESAAAALDSGRWRIC